MTRFLKNHAEFAMDAIAIDNFPFASISEEEVRTVKQLAEEMNCEIWISALSHRDTRKNELGYPDPVEKFNAFLSVKIYLETEEKSIRLRLLKDHENEDLTDLMVDLDPTTLLMKDRQTTG